MIAALLLAAVAPTTAIDAERAFAADARKIGQWTAFRKWSADDALMFTPQPVNAHAFLNGRKDPPDTVLWWPGRSYVSCDGSYAVNTGPWVRDGGKAVGYFTTVWKRQSDGGWKWIYDAGDTLQSPRAEGGDIKPITASCDGEPMPPRVPVQPGAFVIPVTTGGGTSSDRTLAWHWIVDSKGARQFVAQRWTGSGWATVVNDQVAAPPQ